VTTFSRKVCLYVEEKFEDIFSHMQLLASKSSTNQVDMLQGVLYKDCLCSFYTSTANYFERKIFKPGSRNFKPKRGDVQGTPKTLQKRSTSNSAAEVQPIPMNSSSSEEGRGSQGLHHGERMWGWTPGCNIPHLPARSLH